MKKVKVFESEDNSISISACQPSIDGQIQPIELLFVLKHCEDDEFILTFRKEEAKKILKELKHAVRIIDEFS